MKSITHLLHATYCQSFLRQEVLVKTVSHTPVLFPEQLQEIGHNSILANELSAMLDVVTDLELLISFLEDNVNSRKELVERIQEVQKNIQKNQAAVTVPFPDRINAAFLKAKEQPYSIISRETRIPVFEFEPGEYYELDEREINNCFKHASEANIEHLPNLFAHIQELGRVDTTLPTKELKTIVRNIINQTTTL